jgi:hypothetical protein
MQPGGKVAEVVEPLGGIFAAVPGKSMLPAYSYGPGEGAARTREVMFQCPVSAIPDVAFDLLQLWHDCRMMGCLPETGGWVDQHLLVRRAFPIFESEMRMIESRKAAAAPQAAAAAAVAGVVAAGKR